MAEEVEKSEVVQEEAVKEVTQEEKDDAPVRPAWFGQISRDEESAYGDRLRGFGKIGDLAKAYVELSDKAKGFEGSVKVPGEGASEEDVKAFRKAIGVPDDGKYDLTDDGSLYSENGKPVESLKKVYDTMRGQVEALAKEAGLTKKQAQSVWAHQIAFIKAGVDANAAQMANMQKTFSARMDTLYRKDYPDESERQKALDADFAVVGRALGSMPTLSASLQKSGAMLDPANIRELAGYLRSVGAGKTAKGGGQGHPEGRRSEGGLTFSQEFYDHVRGLRNGN